VRRGGKSRRLTAFQAGLVAIVVIAVAVYLGGSKDIPFTRPFQISAVFENAPPMQQGTAVRIAGVDVGKVSKVEPVGGDAQGVKVTMKLKDEALPIHEDAEVKARERIFLEGNLFLDIKPGTPSADTLGDGDTIPASQTAAPVQLEQLLGTLKTNTRKDLQDLLAGYGDALNGQPQPGEDEDQDPSTQGETAGQSLNDSLDYATDSLRGGAVVNQATMGTQPHDLSKLVAGQQKVFRALASREGQLKDLITNFNITASALASREGDLRETVRLLPDVLEAARPALDNLNAAFPPTRAWALEMIPGVEETPATLDAGFPWVRQVRALVSPAELQGLVNDLQPAVDDFARFTRGQIDLLPVLDDFNRCQYDVVLPTGEQTIDEGDLSTGIQNYKEFFQALSGTLGAGQNYTGNGFYLRFQPGGGPFQSSLESGGKKLYGAFSAQPQGTRPARLPKPAYRPKTACHTQPEPDLNSARIGPGP
jgi:ABC-type transporter Mla subunit MlaD